MGLLQSAARENLQDIQASNRRDVDHVVQRHGVERVYEPEVVRSVHPLLPYPVHMFPSWTIGLIQAGGFGRDEDVYQEIQMNTSRQTWEQEALTDRKDEASLRGTIDRNSSKEEKKHVNDEGSSKGLEHYNNLKEEIHMKDGGLLSGMTHRNHLKQEMLFSSGSSSQFSAFWDTRNLGWFQTRSKQSESDELEEEMLQRAIEDSITERIRLNAATVEDDLEQAIAESLKTAEIEKAIHLKKSYGEILEDEIWYVDPNNKNSMVNRNGSTSESSGRRYLQQNSDTLATNANISSRETEEDLEEHPVEHLVRRRSDRHHTNIFSIVPLPESGPYSNKLRNDDWGGLSTEEHQDAIMLEAAILGSISENLALKFGYLYEQHIPATPSATVMAQRQLREQQDIEYLASLEADLEKEAKARIDEEARHLKEVEDRAAAEAEEKHRQQEASLKRLAEEELERQMAAKKALLPEEPSINDEGVIKLMVRMPDGSKQSRRFHGSNPLRCLYDFIDITCGLAPGSYKLVRPYPRKDFSIEEHFLPFQDLGLTSKSEALFLEFVD